MAGAPTIHARLIRRNRLVAILRVGVPVLGALVLVLLATQIYLASFTARFGIGQVTVTPDSVAIEAPEYVGHLEDGAAYRVSARSAHAPADRTSLIDLNEAKVVLDRTDGVQFTADAAFAQLDTIAELTLVSGVADISDSDGMTGILRDSVFDWRSQMLTARGPVEIEQPDGTTVRAGGLVYDAGAVVWTFSRAVVTLPYTPGEDGQ